MNRLLALLTPIMLGAALATVLGCVQVNGSPLEMAPDGLYQKALEFEARNDLVAAGHLLERIETRYPGSAYALLATVKRHQIGIGRIHDAAPGGPGAQRVPRLRSEPQVDSP